MLCETGKTFYPVVKNKEWRSQDFSTTSEFFLLPIIRHLKYKLKGLKHGLNELLKFKKKVKLIN